MTDKKICIIIPIFNESQTIGPLIEFIKTKDMDVVVIDDGSTDYSGEIAQKKGAIIIRHDCKKGKGFSLRDGFKYAVENKYQGVITMDGDGQHDVNDIEKFVQKAEESESCIINGNRMNDVKNMPFIRFMTNRFMSGLISLFARQRIPDTQCGYKYISCDVLNSIELTSNDFEIETEVLMKSAKKGFQILSLNIQTIYGKEKSKINPFKDTARFLGYFLKEIFSSN